MPLQSEIPWELLASKQTLVKAVQVHVLECYVRKSGILGVVQRISEPDETRIVTVTPAGVIHCSCLGSLHGVCSHSIATLAKAAEINLGVTISLLKKTLGETIMEDVSAFLPTDIANFNAIVGGIPIGALFGIYGAPATNKSILASQLAYSFFELGANALLVDTEGGSGAHSLPMWIKRLNERYKLDVKLCKITYNETTDALTFAPEPKKNQPTFFFVDLRVLFKVLAFHGVKVHMEVSKTKIVKDRKTGEVLDEEGGGRLSIRFSGPHSFEEDITKTPIGKLVKSHNIRYLIYDSVTNPLELFVSGQMNNPSRDDAQGLWFQQLQSLACDMDCTISAIFHLSWDPTNPYDVYGRPVGGKAVGHNFKYLLLLSRFQGSGGKTSMSMKQEKINLRKVMMLRHPTKQPLAERLTLELTDAGFKDAKYEPAEDPT